MRKENIILLIGSLLIAARLFFPVLQCSETNVQTYCSDGAVYFFSFKPQMNYGVSEVRTYSEAMGLAIITAALYSIMRKQAKA